MTAAVIERQAPQVAQVPQLLLKPAEAARALGIGPRTLWTLEKRGEVRAVRIGSSVRYAPADLQAYIDSKRGQN